MTSYRVVRMILGRGCGFSSLASSRLLSTPNDSEETALIIALRNSVMLFCLALF